MDDTEFAITNALAGKIYNKLKDDDSGKLSYKDHKILFEAGFRDDNNIPGEATVEVRDVEGYRIGRYNLQFEK